MTTLAKWSGLAGLSVLLVAAAVLGFSLRPAVRSEVAERVYFAGQLWRGTQVRHEFQLRNTGDVDVVLGKIKTTCYCTAVNLDQARVPPGHSARISVVLDTTEFKDGSFTKEVTIGTNDRLHPQKTIAIAGFVRSEFEVADPYVDFGVVLVGQSAVRELEILVSPGRSVRVVSVESGSPHVTASCSAQEGGAVRVIAQLRPLGRPTWLGGNLVVRTTSSFLPEFRIPVAGYVRAR